MSEDPTTPSPEPARSADEAATQAKAIRGRIDEDLRALEARMPAPEALQARAKTYGGAAAAGVATLAALAVALRRRSATRAREQETRRQAEALAAALPDAALQVRQEHVSTPAGRIGLLVAVAALAVAVWARLSGAGGDR